jgi:hypothetical protein
VGITTPIDCQVKIVILKLSRVNMGLLMAKHAKKVSRAKKAKPPPKPPRKGIHKATIYKPKPRPNLRREK